MKVAKIFRSSNDNYALDSKNKISRIITEKYNTNIGEKSHTIGK